MKRKPRIKIIKAGLVICAFCRGKGTDPFRVPSKLSKCQVCLGRKKNYILLPMEECPACLGNGVYRHHRLVCSVCGGRGWLHKFVGKNRKEGCSPENEEVLDKETGLPCISAYDFGQPKIKGRR